MANTIAVKMSWVKATKNTHVYANATDEGDVIPTLYIKKSAYPEGEPKHITVTITEGHDDG